MTRGTRQVSLAPAKEMLIVAGRRLGATTSQLSEITGIDSSSVSRRFDAAARRLRPQRELYDPVERIIAAYNENSEKKQRNIAGVTPFSPQKERRTDLLF